MGLPRSAFLLGLLCLSLHATPAPPPHPTDFGYQNALICHSHDDLGWLTTIEEYYTTKVRDIFDSVLTSLEQSDPADPNKRKFVYSEVGFLRMYIEEFPELRPRRVKRIRDLIARGQWEFVNGGISQPDSACPHYEDLILNYFYGLSYLKRNFGATSTTCWQLDPFGHSKALHYFAARFGMTHSVMGRIPETLREEWRKDRKLDFLWRFDDRTSIISHVKYHYYPPKSLACDTDCRKSDFSLGQFEQDCALENSRYRYNNFFTVGGDFQWTRAQSRFEFVDLAVRTGQHPAPAQYALFSEFAQEFRKRKANETLPVFEGDFFVYHEGTAEKGDNWSGYFTTKPRLKGRVRHVGKMLRAVKNLIASRFFQVNIDRRQKCLANLFDAMEDFGVLLHHDAITGTAKEAVDRDYFRRLELVERKIEYALGNATALRQEFCDFQEYWTRNNLNCQWLKVLEANHFVAVNVFNPALFEVQSVRRIPLPLCARNMEVKVFDRDGIPVKSATFCQTLSDYCEVSFKTVVGPFGIDLFKFNYELKAAADIPQTAPETPIDPGRSYYFNFTEYSAMINKTHILLRGGWSDKHVNILTYRFRSAVNSGHYILKYMGIDWEYNYSNQFTVERISNPIFEGFFIRGSNLNVLVRKNMGDRVFEVQTFVLPKHAFKKGIDVVLVVKAPFVDNGDDFSTDSNGYFQMTRKKKGVRENGVFPVTSVAKIEGRTSGHALAIFNDRAQGVYGEQGTLGFYIQRSARRQDHKGNDEVLKVSEPVVTTHYLYNYDLNDPEVDTKWTYILQKMDIEQLIFSAYQSPKDQGLFPRRESQPGSRASSPNHSDPGLDPQEEAKNLRINFEFVDLKRIIARIQNISHKKHATFDYDAVVGTFIPEANVRQVDFSYVFLGDEGEAAEVGSVARTLFEIAPRQFLTLLIEPKEKPAQELKAVLF